MSRRNTSTIHHRAANKDASVAATASRVVRRRKQHTNPTPQARGDNGDDFAELFGVEPFLRNQVTVKQIDHLRNRLDSEGPRQVLEDIGICETSLLRLCAGFGHRNTRAVAAKVREYFAGAKKS